MESYREAALIYFRCRKAGVTIRSTIDCLIARTVIEKELVLVRYDGDFGHMRENERNDTKSYYTMTHYAEEDKAPGAS